MSNANLEIRIRNFVKKSPNRSLSVSELVALLAKAEIKATPSEIKLCITKMVAYDARMTKARKKRKYYLKGNKGGNGVRFIGGGEIVRKGTGPYRDIARVIDRESHKIQSIFKAEHLNSFDVHAGRSARGAWGRPDMLVALYRTEGKSRPFARHTIEYEKLGGFSAANIAQAYYSGRGADKSWLLFDARDWPKNKKERDRNPDFESIVSFAQELGIGLISYRDLASSQSWKVHLEAKQRKRDKDSRLALKDLYS
jgi:hypothetical protein